MKHGIKAHQNVNILKGDNHHFHVLEADYKIRTWKHMLMVLKHILFGRNRSSTLDFGPPDSPAIWGSGWQWIIMGGDTLLLEAFLDEMLNIMVVVIISIAIIMFKGMAIISMVIVIINMFMVIITMVFTLLEAFLRRCSGASLPFPAATFRTTSFAWLPRWLWCLCEDCNWCNHWCSRLPELIISRNESSSGTNSRSNWNGPVFCFAQPQVVTHVCGDLVKISRADQPARRLRHKPPGISLFHSNIW